MATIRPFRALRPAASLAQQVASLPYDAIDAGDVRRALSENPNSFLRVIRAEETIGLGNEPYRDEVYAASKGELDKFVADGVFLQDNTPSLYLYEIASPVQPSGLESFVEGRVQTGVVAALALSDLDQKLLRVHEKTRPSKEDDRTKHILTLRAQTGPLMLCHRRSAELSSLIVGAKLKAPEVEFIACDGTRQRVWRIVEVEPWIKAFAELGVSYVADGHHRLAAARRVNRELGTDESAGVMAVLFAEDELRILPYNRALSIEGKSSQEILNSISAHHTLEPMDFFQSPQPGSVAVYGGGKWYKLDLSAYRSEEPTLNLDVSRLTRAVLEPIFEIVDQTRDERLHFLGGVEVEKFIQRTDAGEFSCLFIMHPVSVDDLIRVSDADALMPPKSTWFSP